MILPEEEQNLEIWDLTPWERPKEHSKSIWLKKKWKWKMGLNLKLKSVPKYTKNLKDLSKKRLND